MKKLFGYIHSYEEALLVVHAVRLGYLEAIEERLTKEERKNIKSGDIFCFIESEKGMKRWTDGKIWSPSKIHGQFLLYKEVPKHMNKSSIEKRNQQKYLMGISGRAARREKTWDWEDKLSFHKKTISINYQSLTYHVIAYFRPMFSGEPLINIPFFNQLDKVLRSKTELFEDKFMERYPNKRDLYEEFDLPSAPNEALFPTVKRSGLEKLASSVLCELKMSKRFHMA
jgi:Gti1/Pac2 family transcription factor